MCRSSTITIGSATAVLRLRSPEVEEPDHQGKHGPAYAEEPEVIGIGVVVAVCAVIPVGPVLGIPQVAQVRVVRLAARFAPALRQQQRIAHQRDVESRGVELLLPDYIEEG